LLKSQSVFRDQKKKLFQIQNKIFAKLIYFRKQKKLLRKQTDNFIVCKYKNIAELEKFEYREIEKLKYLDDEYTVSEYKKYKTESSRIVSESINYIFVGNR